MRTGCVDPLSLSGGQIIVGCMRDRLAEKNGGNGKGEQDGTKVNGVGGGNGKGKRKRMASVADDIYVDEKDRGANGDGDCEMREEGSGGK